MNAATESHLHVSGFRGVLVARGIESCAGTSLHVCVVDGATTTRHQSSTSSYSSGDEEYLPGTIF